MLRFHRRLWAVVAALIGAIPLLVTVLAPGREGVQVEERRAAASAPKLPHVLPEVLALPRRVDAYLADHFGLRREMIRGYSKIAHAWLRDGTSEVLVGLDGWLFLRADSMVDQSAGLVLRRDRVAETADTVARIRDALETRGVRFVFASPPNSATIYPEMLPEWAHNQGRVTEIDLLLRELAARRVQVVDLRPALREARADGDAYYRHDTHWTDRGIIAGFNALTAAAGHPEWHVDPSTALAPPTTRVGGDLARMLGVSTDVSEPAQLLNLPDDKQELLTSQPFATYRSVSTAGGRRTIMILGDSFTIGQFGRLVLRHAPQYVWTHHWFCSFDWKWIDRFHPDEVWMMPTERNLLCRPGAQPFGLPSVPAQALSASAESH